MTALDPCLKQRHGAKGRGYWTTLLEPIAGVISTAPAYLMNKDADGQPIALVGRVPCIVSGPITKGAPALAIADGKASMNGSGPIVGIALETNTDNGDKLVEIMLKL